MESLNCGPPFKPPVRALSRGTLYCLVAGWNLNFAGADLKKVERRGERVNAREYQAPTAKVSAVKRLLSFTNVAERYLSRIPSV